MATGRRCGRGRGIRAPDPDRPVLRTARSWVGLATPRVAANASAISSSLKTRGHAGRRAVASVRTASTSIMLARSTAWRQGEGRTWTKKASTSRTLPSRTIRLAGLTSRWARPASHSWRISCRPLSITWSSTGAVPISWAPAKNSITIRYSRSGVISTNPNGAGTAMPTWLQPQQRVVLVLHKAAYRLEGCLVLQRAVQDGAAQLVGAVGAHVAFGVQLGEQVTLGLRRRWRRPAAAAGWTRPSPPGRPVDVQDPQAQLLLDGVADGLPAAATDIQVRGLAAPVGDREHLVGREEAKRHHGDRHAKDEPATRSLGLSTARYIRASPTAASDVPTAHFPCDRGRPGGNSA